jgi:hypothetical protein
MQSHTIIHHKNTECWLHSLTVWKQYWCRVTKWAKQPPTEPWIRNTREQHREGGDLDGLFTFPAVASQMISWLLGKFNIKTVYIPAKKSSHILKPMKDNWGLKVSGVYSISCKCGKVYIGQTGQSIETRCNEDDSHLHFYQQDKSSVAKHSTGSVHRIMLQKANILAKTSGYTDHLAKRQ